MRPALTITLPAAILLVLLTGAPASAAGDPNEAVAVVTTDRTAVVDVSVAVALVDDGVVDQRNEAVAVLSCVSCSAFAGAYQTVLVSGGASTIAPYNAAAAVNAGCTNCSSRATARQDIRSVSPRALATVREAASSLPNVDGPGVSLRADPSGFTLHRHVTVAR